MDTLPEKGPVVKGLQTIAIIAAVIFWIMPLRTWISATLCAIAGLVYLACKYLARQVNNDDVGATPNKPDKP